MQIPSNRPTYVIGDIHGHLKKLVKLLQDAQLIDDYIFMHADASLSLKYGHSVNEVNTVFNKLLHRSDALAWEERLEDFAQRGVFMHTTNGEEFYTVITVHSA